MVEVLEEQLTFEICEPRNIFEAIRLFGPDPRFEAFAECEPTICEPGTPEKIRVMKERLEAGESLWNEADAKLSVKSGYSELTGLFLMAREDVEV